MTRLLLIDDAPSFRMSLVALLEDEGFEVDEADSHETALARLDHARYDGVLLDVNLCKQNGLELVLPIRERCPGAAIVVLSGSPIGAADASEVDAALLKTESFADVLATLRRVLHGAG